MTTEYEYLPEDERAAVDRCIKKACDLPRSQIAKEDLSDGRRAMAQNIGKDGVTYTVVRPGQENRW